MNRDQAKQLLPIIQAFAEGKTVQWFNDLGDWKNLKEASFHLPPDRYRIKPETIKIEHRRFIHKHPSKDVFSVICVNTKAEVIEVETWPTFVRWIDPDWITEEVEINHD